MESLAPTQDQGQNSAEVVGGTVLELMAVMGEMPNEKRMSTPPPTPPVEMQTTTRSGEGFAQMSDDSMTDHMYE